MFSLMLMTAVASGPDTTGFGFRSAGCYGSCYGSTVSAGCYGSACYGSSCYGSSCYGSSCYGSSCYGSSCYGSSCYGSSCYGSSCQGSQPGLFARLCARLHSRKASYASCHGSCYGSSCHGASYYSASCYGSSCHGSSCYGSSCYGSSCIGSSCYGSSCYGSGYGVLPPYTGNSCYGSTPSYYEGSAPICNNAAPIYNGGVMPGTIIGNDMPAVEVPTAPIEEQPTIETTSAKISIPVEAAPALLTVTVPENAKLYVDGQLTNGEGTTRQFHTPSLQPGQTYYYEMKVEVEMDGDVKTQTKRVLVESGATLSESFDDLQDDEAETMTISTK